MKMTPKEILTTLYSWLGPRAVLLPFPLGQKDAKGTGWLNWQTTTFERTQESDYQARLYKALERGGNIGVLLINGLVSTDIDSDDGVEQMLELNPEFTETLQSKGRRGRNIWLQIAGEYPQKVYHLRTTDGKKWGEWRGGGGSQTIIFGQHPDSTPDRLIHYSCISPKPTMQGRFEDIAWPEDLILPWLKNEVKTQSAPIEVNSNLHDRILAYLAAIPGAAQGNGGDEQTFTVACALINGWGLAASEAMPYLQIYSAKCEPPWRDKELQHKLAKAETAAHENQKGTSLDVVID